ncbi:ACP S-malonyltransferase [Roseateles flavus]
MFPGQGSQEKGMGGDLFDQFPELTAQADAVLGYSIRTLCLEDPRNELNNTRFTQAALYVVNALNHLRKMQAGGRRPDYLIGHSLGEFNALLAAGCYSFETGLRLVKKRGELMAQVSGGAMAAILNASQDFIERTLFEAGLDDVSVANYNTPSQLVISGPAEQLAKAEPLLRVGKTRFYPLNTSGAFHSKYMQPAQAAFAAFLEGFTFSPPTVPVIANASASAYAPDAVAKGIAQQIASPVRWCESIQGLLASATAQGRPLNFEELGHGDVLTRLVLAIRQQTASPPASAAVAPAPAPRAVEQRPLSAVEKIAAWNRLHPVGSRMRSLRKDYPELETRSDAVVLFGHRAAVYMKGYSGYFDIDELVPA